MKACLHNLQVMFGEESSMSKLIQQNENLHKKLNNVIVIDVIVTMPDVISPFYL